MFLLAQAQEDLHLARSTDKSADVLRLQEEIRQAEIKIKQMSSERDTLLERLKVSPRALTSAMHEIPHILILGSEQHFSPVNFHVEYFLVFFFVSHSEDMKASPWTCCSAFSILSYFAGCPDVISHRQTGGGEQDS